MVPSMKYCFRRADGSRIEARVVPLHEHCYFEAWRMYGRCLKTRIGQPQMLPLQKRALLNKLAEHDVDEADASRWLGECFENRSVERDALPFPAAGPMSRAG